MCVGRVWTSCDTRRDLAAATASASAVTHKVPVYVQPTEMDSNDKKMINMRMCCCRCCGCFDVLIFFFLASFDIVLAGISLRFLFCISSVHFISKNTCALNEMRGNWILPIEICSLRWSLCACVREMCSVPYADEMSEADFYFIFSLPTPLFAWS